MSAEDVKCPHYNSGFCKFKQKCKFFHPIDKCERSCKEKTCRKRHPKLCKQGSKCSFFVAGTCAYNHPDVTKEEKTGIESEFKELVTTLSSKVESLSESINIKDKEISALKYKIDALEKKTMESKEPDLDETLNENDWKEGVDKVHRLEGTVGKLQDLAEKNEQTTNYNTIGISDTEKVVNTLIDVVNEQDQTILMMEKKAKEKEDKIVFNKSSQN